MRSVSLQQTTVQLLPESTLDVGLGDVLVVKEGRRFECGRSVKN